MEGEVINAKIEEIWLGDDDHGGITCWLHTKLQGGSNQAFGGYDLRWWGGYFLQRVLAVVGVDNWEDCAGKTIRVKRSDGLIVAIGNDIEEIWLEPRSEVDKKAALAMHERMLKART